MNVNGVIIFKNTTKQQKRPFEQAGEFSGFYP